MMVDKERRNQARRKSDRDLLDKVGGGNDAQADSELRRVRRRAIRHNCTVHVALLLEYQVKGQETWSPEEHPVKGRILDLSGTGCSLFTSQCLEIGQKLSLGIVMKKGAEISTKGTVRWSKRIVEKRGYVSGVEFEGLGKRDANAIATFLQRLDDTTGL